MQGRASPHPSVHGLAGFAQLAVLDSQARQKVSFLEGARDVQMVNLQYIQANNAIFHRPASPVGKKINGWKHLVENMATNALHDSGARYDPPKCDEDTRTEVIRELEQWLADSDNPQRLLCMTGAAGSGKSALQQTLAERCDKSGILGSAYFFSSTDPTRNTLSTIVPTIAFQFGSRYPPLKRSISAIVEDDPVIFERSLQTQMDNLLVRPLRELRQREELEFTTLRHAILIDGLDECHGEKQQKELLTALRQSLLSDDLPFRVFIASRPELAIRMALEPGGHLHTAAYHLQLNDKYDASDDMRRYLRRGFQALSSRTGNPNWFTEGDIETLVEAGSGQFIYVATVLRYISEPRDSPAKRLKIVLNWTPHNGQNARPFEVLDKLYTDILLTAKEAYEGIDTNAKRDFLLLFMAHHVNCVDQASRIDLTNIRLNKLLNLEKESTASLVSDLHSLVEFNPKSSRSYLHMFHKSFSDFLEDENRAKNLFVSVERVFEHLANCAFDRIIESRPSSKSLVLQLSISKLATFLWEAQLLDLDEKILEFTDNEGWLKIDASPVRATLEDHWYKNLDVLANRLRERDPVACVSIISLVDKWKDEDVKKEQRKREEEEKNRDEIRKAPKRPRSPSIICLSP